MASTEKIEEFLAEPRNVIVAGARRDGSPHLSPNWFTWDGERFYISTKRDRVKYKIFKRDPRISLAIDDSTGFRAVLVRGTVEIREELADQAPRFRAIRDKHGRPAVTDEELLDILQKDDRVILAVTPDGPPSTWNAWGLD